MQKVPIETLRLEADLFATKWHDYKVLHPVCATYLYAHHYQQMVRDFCRENHDHTRADSIIAFSDVDVFKSRELGSVIAGRQRLDSIGVRYDFAMRLITTRYSQRGWPGAPRPNQVYSQELVLDIRDAWIAQCEQILQIPHDDVFRVDPKATELSRLQHEYVEWAFCFIERRNPALRWMPLSRMLGEGVVTEQAVAQRFGLPVLQRALKSVSHR